MSTRPDMRGRAADIDDPMHLFARIGYRAWLLSAGDPSGLRPLYARFDRAELARLTELLGQPGRPQTRPRSTTSSDGVTMETAGGTT